MLEYERHKIEINTDNSDGLNIFFSMHELKCTIRQEHNTTPGRDGLEYEMFKHMDDLTPEEMLSLINTMCEHIGWKHAVIVPFLKPGKEVDGLGSYRPIALTAVICKIMERMVTDRLVHRLE